MGSTPGVSDIRERERGIANRKQECHVKRNTDGKAGIFVQHKSKRLIQNMQVHTQTSLGNQTLGRSKIVKCLYFVLMLHHLFSSDSAIHSMSRRKNVQRDIHCLFKTQF
jgi:hypothetical protein